MRGDVYRGGFADLFPKKWLYGLAHHVQKRLMDLQNVGLDLRSSDGSARQFELVEPFASKYLRLKIRHATKYDQQSKLGVQAGWRTEAE
jgi:hypothetical protein